MSDPTNDDRAQRAAEALVQYAKASGQLTSGDWQHEPETVLSDLLCDLRHWADREGVDYNLANRNGQDHHQEECDNDEELDPDEIPPDWPVQPVSDWTDPDAVRHFTTCGTCGLTWDDSKATSMTPTPAGRCPFERFHR